MEDNVNVLLRRTRSLVGSCIELELTGNCAEWRRVLTVNLYCLDLDRKAAWSVRSLVSKVVFDDVWRFCSDCHTPAFYVKNAIGEDL